MAKEDIVNDLEKYIKEYMKIFEDTKLNSQKTASVFKVEEDIIHKLIISAWELDKEEIFEGSYSIISLIIGQLLQLRNMIRELKFENLELKKQIQRQAAQPKVIT